MIRKLGYQQGAIRSDKQFIPYLINMPEAPADTVQFRGWVSDTCLLNIVRVLMVNVNTNGNYTLKITNTTQGIELLENFSFDMNSVLSDVITEVPLIASEVPKTFDILDRWTIELTSDSSSFNGEGVYIELVFEVI